MRKVAIQHSRPPFIAIALLSACALAYEVLLMRMFSIVQWHHFAYMVISLALLGYGVSGTFLSLAQAWLIPRFKNVFCINLGLFGISTVFCYLLAQQIPFNPETVLWDMRQPLYLLLMYMLLAVPFFFAANAIGLMFIVFRTQISSAYAADLLGAGLGSLGVVALLLIVFPLSALVIIGGLGLLSMLIAVWQLQLTHRFSWSGVALGAVLFIILIGQQAELQRSPYKSLSQTLQIGGAEVREEVSSPLGLLTVVESAQVPLRYAPGLSLMAQNEPPRQVALFTDGAGMTVVNDGNVPPKYHQYLNQLTWALPYFLLSPERVLILGAGGGSEVLQARLHDVKEIHAVELNPQLTTLIRERYGNFTAHLYDQSNVFLHNAEARGFIAAADKRYHLIQLPLLDSFATSASGLYALNESYLYTVEALKLFIDHLEPGGYLAISRWINLPPKDTPKLFATAVNALEEMGVKEPGKQLVLIRGWQTSTLLVKNGIVNSDDVETIREFSGARAFDVSWFPGIQPDEVNRYNVLEEAYFFNAAHALLGEERYQFLDQYKFNLVPARDDKPYFFQFFKWRTLPEIVDQRNRGGMPLFEWGYLVLVATLLQAMLVSTALILLPLIVWRKRQSTRRRSSTHLKQRVLVYFSAIGLAFLFIEIAFIQRLILFLHHPLYATAVVLSGFLVFAGFGSAFARWLSQTKYIGHAVRYAVFGIVCISLLYLMLLEPLFQLLMAWHISIKIVAALILIMPLAFCMGLPFPLVLERLGKEAGELIPWAWGVNGCASVISAVLATLLAIHLGFSSVILIALTLYLVAAFSLPGLSQGKHG